MIDMITLDEATRRVLDNTDGYLQSVAACCGDES